MRGAAFPANVRDLKNRHRLLHSFPGVDNKPVRVSEPWHTSSSATKTHSGTRTILSGENALNELRAQRERTAADSRTCPYSQSTALIFPSRAGTPFSKTDVQREFGRVLKLPNLPRIRFHELRHTATRHVLNNHVPGLVVSRILGYPDSSVTLTIYAHTMIDTQDTGATIMDEIIAPIARSVPQLHPRAISCSSRRSPGRLEALSAPKYGQFKGGTAGKWVLL
jgi:integrase